MTALSAQDLAHSPRQVLTAALVLFSRWGYFNTTVHDIAREAGVSIGSIYHHFGDKTGIARALYRHLLEFMTASIEEVMAREADAQARCRAIVTLLFETTEREPRGMEFMLYAKHREFMPDETPVCSSRPFELMREIVADGMARGDVRRLDPMVAATALFGGPLRMITARLDGILPRALPTYLDEVWECAWKAVAA